MSTQVVRDLRPLLAGMRSGMSAAEVGRWLGISRERVRQIWVRETGEAHVPTRRSARDQDSVRIRRFWASVAIRETGCWEWTGGVYPSGYGVPGYRAEPPNNGYAHRASYKVLVGPIPAGLTIDHLCRNLLCVNPAHLEAVTQRTNTLRSPIARAAINARKTHCINGHEFSPSNTRITTGASGHPQRACRACARAHQRNYRRKAA